MTAEEQFKPPVCIQNSADVLAGNDADRTSPLRRGITALTIAAAGGALVFEQSPLNEALRINVGLEVLRDTSSAAAVGLAVASLTAVIEMVPSALISVGLNSDGGTISKLKARLSRKSQDATDDVAVEQATYKKLNLIGHVANKGANVGIALGLGAGLVTVKEHMRDPEPTLAKDMTTSAKASGIVAGVSGGIGYMAAGGINHANGTIMERPAELFVDYGTDTKFWISALAIGYGAYYVKKGIQKLLRKRDSARQAIQNTPSLKSTVATETE